ncbi:MAG: hypothetical protein GXX01_00045 [Clostridiales bacterium]|jgi:hypothetical protein|nr:hypothetical protein [Clostridiales bacterium]
MLDLKDIESYQNLLNKIPGVINTKVVANEEGKPTEIHVLADLSRGPKQIVRDVQSALLASYNLSVDHKIISVAQIEDNNIGVRESRLAIESIQIYSKSGKIEACILLKKDEQLYEGIAVGGNSSKARMRVISEAVLRAIHRYLKQDFIFILSDVIRVNLTDQEVIVVSITHLTDKGEEYLSGSAFIKNDEDEAVVKATLNALNRRLTVYSTQ